MPAPVCGGKSAIRGITALRSQGKGRPLRGPISIGSAFTWALLTFLRAFRSDLTYNRGNKIGTVGQDGKTRDLEEASMSDNDRFPPTLRIGILVFDGFEPIDVWGFTEAFAISRFI